MKTSYYANVRNMENRDMVVSISRDKGEDANFEGKSFIKLAPKKDFFSTWKHRKKQLEEDFSLGKISLKDFEKFTQENEDYYIENFYNNVLKPLDASETYNTLGDDAVLLCYEKPTQFCHRFLVAGWLELCLGVTVDEWGFENDLAVKQNKDRLKQKVKECIDRDHDREDVEEKTC